MNFDEAVARLVALIDGRSDTLSAGVLAQVTAGLASSVRRKTSGLSPADVDDIVSAAILRFVEVVHTPNRLDRDKPAAAYLTTIAHHVAIDLLRRRQRRPETESVDAVKDRAADDLIARFLRAESSRSVIRAALAVAARNRDYNVTRVVAVWRDLASELERDPTTREVAEEAGVSHTTVRRALARFEEIVKAVPGDPLGA